jgi:hypothetical protein
VLSTSNECEPIWKETFTEPSSKCKNIQAIGTTGNDGSQVPGGTSNKYLYNTLRYIRTTGGTGTASGQLAVDNEFGHSEPGSFTVTTSGGVTKINLGPVLLVLSAATFGRQAF